MRCPGAVCGAILGVQVNRKVEILNSFELVFNITADGSIELDRAYFQEKTTQFKEVFKSLEVLVWRGGG